MRRYTHIIVAIVVLGTATPVVAQQTLRIVNYSELTQQPTSEYTLEFDETGLLRRGVQYHLDDIDTRVKSEILLETRREGNEITINTIRETQEDNGRMYRSPYGSQVTFGETGTVHVSGATAFGDFAYSIEIGGCDWWRFVETDEGRAYIGMERLDATRWMYRNEVIDLTTIFEVSTEGELIAFSSGRTEARFYRVEQMEDSGVSITEYQDKERNEGSLFSRVEVYGDPVEVPIRVAIANYEIITDFYEIRYEMLPFFFSAAICDE